MPVTPKPAATVVLMRDREPGRGRPEVLLLERHGKSSFGAGAYVFPGGVVEPEDLTPAAARLSPHLSGAAAQARMEGVEGPQQALAFHIAAIRETFEEALLLLAEGPEGAPAALPARAELEAARERLHTGSLGFAEWIAAQGLALATQRLVYYAHWITPEAVPLRFSARFFLLAAPADAEAVPDRREVLRERWLEPAEAIALQRRGAIHLMDPTVRNLELLGTFASTGQALRELNRREVRAILPKLTVRADGTRQLLYPWDAAYGQA
jgi:8-oxo-dGTP pyrophosphatase MutT (NUDIX family)